MPNTQTQAQKWIDILLVSGVNSPYGTRDGRRPGTAPGPLRCHGNIDAHADPGGATGRNEVFEVLYNPAPAWTCFHGMQCDEVLLFKQYDSATDMPCHTPHAAFTRPATPTDTPPRECIEIRCLLIVD